MLSRSAREVRRRGGIEPAVMKWSHEVEVAGSRIRYGLPHGNAIDEQNASELE
jgi:hypothetical protein